MPGPAVATAGALACVRQTIVSCTRCARLRAWCEVVAAEKKAAHRQDVYWGKPVPGFGDPAARVLVLGLAPAAHGANRTGRIFTGDGSGDFLMTAMQAEGFANIATSRSADDGLELTDAYIIAAVRCAPPANKPLREEIANCAPHLHAEIAALPHVRVVVALGRVAADAYWRWLAGRGITMRPKPGFAHAAVVPSPAIGIPALVQSYHPSRQNTNTGKLTPPMLRMAFAKARRLADARP
jgi:uracil-DNA glycosylase family 4